MSRLSEPANREKLQCTQRRTVEEVRRYSTNVVVMAQSNGGACRGDRTRIGTSGYEVERSKGARKGENGLRRNSMS